MSGLYVGTEKYPSYFGLSISDRRYRWYFWEFNISGTSAIFLRVKKIGVTDDIFERSTYRRYRRYFESKLFNYTKCRKNIGDNGEMFMILGTNSMIIKSSCISVQIMCLICTKYQRYRRYFEEVKILGVSALFLGGQHIGDIGDIFGRLTVQPWASNARVKKKYIPWRNLTPYDNVARQLVVCNQRQKLTGRTQILYSSKNPIAKNVGDIGDIFGGQYISFGRASNTWVNYNTYRGAAPRATTT